MTRCVITKYESNYKIYMFQIIKEVKEKKPLGKKRTK